ncbi:methyl-accepting chemotaxis protein [Borrelia sp. BU AG58]|uniref:methyl-accepting chemotaxis protein n=1 Tax=Borrelia sp. BU AG58 TaxID=2887345 RepID=UPI001E3086BC|nr:methyl-accepting chemotaxis protein [Borrelia sp. BU AG58]UER67741.1 methyl-accepting chemotaxis protein [Borrelia sp. BU AG58]
MQKFSFFNKKKASSVEEPGSSGGIADKKKDLHVYEYKAPVKELVKGFYHTKASVSSVVLGMGFLYKNIFANFDNLDEMFEVLIKMTNEARSQVSLVFSSIEDISKEKLKKITAIIVGVQESLETINSFLGATNMISLNAKLEAARAKEYGKGFAVVADEIKRLSDQAKSLVNMISVKEIETVSRDLISENVRDLQLDIDKFFSSFLEELGSLNSLFKHFVEQKVQFSTLVDDLESIEASIYCLTRSCDSLSCSDTFMYSNDEFLKELEFIVSEQMSWIDVLKLIVENRRCMAIQTEPMKHGFGLFYKGLSPKHADIKVIWGDVYSYYLNMHKLAVDILKIFTRDDFDDDDLKKAGEFLSQAEGISEEIIKKLEYVKNKVFELDNRGINIFI